MGLLTATLLADGAYLWPERQRETLLDEGLGVYVRMPEGVERCIGTYVVGRSSPGHAGHHVRCHRTTAVPVM